MLINVKMNCWHFNIYEQDKFGAQLSWVWKMFYNLSACSLKLVIMARNHKIHVRIANSEDSDQLVFEFFEHLL